MQNILINGLQLSNTNTGVQYYTQQLFNELKKIETDTFKFHLIQPETSEFRPSFNSRLKRILFENFSLPNYLIKNNYSLYHSPNYVLPYFLNFRSVLTIHDLITFDYPELCQTESVLYFKSLLNRSVIKAGKIIAVSKTVKNDILRHFNIPDEKIEVIYLGINRIFKKIENTDAIAKVRLKYRLPDKFILFIGNIEPKKNLERLIMAFNLLLKTTELDYKLVIVGKKGWKYRSVFKTVDELKLCNNNEVIFTGYIPEEDLPVVYSMAGLFVFPSLYEGFGIPPLEAMACEVPVIISNRGSLPEITGGKCFKVNPYNINDITAGMHKILTDNNLKAMQIKEGKQWIKQFTWENTAGSTLNVYEEILKFKPLVER